MSSTGSNDRCAGMSSTFRGSRGAAGIAASASKDRSQEMALSGEPLSVPSLDLRLAARFPSTMMSSNVTFLATMVHRVGMVLRTRAWFFAIVRRQKPMIA